MHLDDEEAQNEFEEKLSQFAQKSCTFTRKLIIPGSKVTLVTLDSAARPYSSGTYLDLHTNGVNVEDANSLFGTLTEDSEFTGFKPIIEGRNILGIDIGDKNRFLIREKVKDKKGELGYDYFIYCNVLPFRFEWYDGGATRTRCEKYCKEFISWAKKYFEKDSGIVISVPPVGKLYADEVLKQLNYNGIYVDYVVAKETLSVKPADLADKKVLIIDSVSIPEASELLERMGRIRERYNIKDIRYSVEYDPEGIADWSLYHTHTSPSESETSIFSRLRELKPKL